MTRWSRRLCRAALVAVIVGLTGCTIVGVGPTVDDSGTLHAQAQAALARWTAAVRAAGGSATFIPVGDRTIQVGDWEEAVGGNDKVAMLAGLVQSAVALSAVAPPDGQVHWPDGSTSSVRLISAQQALADLKTDAAGSPCSPCTPLIVVKAELTNRTIPTSRGLAKAPAWEFALQGTIVHLARPAVTGVTVVPPAWDPNNPPVGLAIDSAIGSISGRQLTVGFVGAPGTGDEACGADYTAEAVESADAVVVIVTEHPNQTVGACTAVGAQRTTTAQLAAPLGYRAVLEVQQGLPVSVQLTP